MKKLTLLLFVVILLAACQPASPPAPVEALAGSIDDLVGTWWFAKVGLMEFKSDGTYQVYVGSPDRGLIQSGNYTFESGKVSLPGCPEGSAVYEAFITKQEGKPVSLRMQVLGSDPCEDRAELFASDTGKFYNP